jgi:hypothetical protein
MITLTGDKELERVLKRLPNNVQRNLAKRSMRKGDKNAGFTTTRWYANRASIYVIWRY